MLGGFYIRLSNVPSFLQWLKYTSAFRYGYESILVLQIRLGNPIICQGGYYIAACRYLPIGSILPTKDLELYLDTQDVSIELYLCLLLVIGFSLRFFAYLALR